MNEEQSISAACRHATQSTYTTNHLGLSSDVLGGLIQSFIKGKHFGKCTIVWHRLTSCYPTLVRIHMLLSVSTTRFASHLLTVTQTKLHMELTGSTMVIPSWADPWPPVWGVKDGSGVVLWGNQRARTTPRWLNFVFPSTEGVWGLSKKSRTPPLPFFFPPWSKGPCSCPVSLSFFPLPDFSL